MKQSARAAAPSLSRRTFVAAAAAMGAVAAAGLSGCAPKAEESEGAGGSAPTGEDPFADCDLVYGCCSPECQHHLLKGYVRDGKLVKVESGEVNECPACAKGFARVEMCNSDKRLTKPLKLVGAKGSGEFEEISWDEAIDLIEEKINYALENGGSQSIIVQGGSGNFSSLNGAMGTLGSWLGGTTATSGNMCCAGIDAGVSTILGKRSQPTRNEFENSDYILAWGNNPVVTLCGYFGRIQKMMDAAARCAPSTRSIPRPPTSPRNGYSVARHRLGARTGHAEGRHRRRPDRRGVPSHTRRRPVWWTTPPAPPRSPIRRRHHLPGVGHHDERRGRP